LRLDHDDIMPHVAMQSHFHEVPMRKPQHKMPEGWIEG
jgi:hypothetical protein